MWVPNKHKTDVVATELSLQGMFILTLAVSLKTLKPPRCDLALGIKCAKATPKEVGFFWLALAFLVVALGGVRPVTAPLAADQFDETVATERCMKLSFLNGWFVCVNMGALAAQSFLVYLEDNLGWGWGWGLPMAGYALALVLMLCGMPYYRHKLPSGSPLTSIAQVLVAATRNLKATVPSDKSLLYDTSLPQVTASARKTGSRAYFETEHTESLK